VSDIIARLTKALADRYRIERELGAGGMATVYLAEDLKHDRKVALKVLKPELAAVLGAERFVVEIKTTAALQHPHILPLFDSGTADGFLYYVMPFIDGETLRSKLDRETQLGIDESVRIATNIAEALDYAHRHGVIHRDIKPENILLHDGRPMVADFGIALALSAAAGGRMTETGLSLGTPHYMSPEQATADKDVSARSDIYSLASVLYEMLAGQPPHLGGSAQQIIMKIITEPVDAVTRYRKSVPPNVAAAVAKALEKLPSDRFENAAAFAGALANPSFRHGEATVTDGAHQKRSARWRDPVTVGLGVVALAASVVAALAMMLPAPTQLVGKYAVAFDSTGGLAYRGFGEPARLAITPDGSNLVYVGYVSGPGQGRNQLYVRPFGSLASRALPGTVGATRPAISQDGSLIAFIGGSNETTLLAVPLGGGPALTLADSFVVSGPAWGPKGFVYYLTWRRKTSDAPASQTIRRVSGNGGPSEDVVRLPATENGSAYQWLTILPGGRGAIVGVRPAVRGDVSRYMLHAVDLKTGRLGASLPGISARYVAEAHALIYVTSDGSLMAVPFNLSRREVKGRPQALATGVSGRGGETDLDAAGGMLVYALQGVNGTERMGWVNRATGVAQVVDSTWGDTEFESFAISPDGSRLAVTVGGRAATDQTNQGRFDIWLKQLDHGPITRLSFGGETNSNPSWTPDGKYVTYASTRGRSRSLWRRRADGVGAEELVVDAGRDIIASNWSPDGVWLLLSVARPPSLDILVKRVGVDSIAKPLLAEPHHEWKPTLSPDGKWLAYVSNESGAGQVFVRPFPNVQDGKWQISLNGGTDPLWSANGRELFFRSFDGDEIFAADMSRGPGMAERRRLFRALTGGYELNTPDRMFDVSRDGQRFLLSINADTDVSGNLIVVQNFTAELRATLASGKTKK
jgi:eukaryotic-like serine/threonine-protein kinase